MPVCVRDCRVLPSLLLIALALGGCSPSRSDAGSSKSKSLGDLPGVRDGPPVARSDAGLEIVVFGTTAGSPRFAEVLGSYVDRPLPLPRELESLWSEHGVRIVSVPLNDVPAIIEALQSSGSAIGARERQWLGQAYGWTEAVRGPAIMRPTTVALDAERIQLESGALRLLVRGWLEPVPPPVGLPVGAMSPSPVVAGAQSNPITPPQDPTAALRVEFVPQHLEAAPRASDQPFAAPGKASLDPIAQGLVFTRLYTKAQMSPDRALLVFAERPGVTWSELAKRSAAVEPEPPRTTAAAQTSSASPWPKPADRNRPERGDTAHPWGEPSTSTKAIAKSQPSSTRGTPGVGQVVRGEREQQTIATNATPDSPQAEDGAAIAIGPSAPRVPALGEAMLSSVRKPIDDRSPSVRERAVIVLIPHVPSGFRLSP